MIKSLTSEWSRAEQQREQGQKKVSISFQRSPQSTLTSTFASRRQSHAARAFPPKRHPPVPAAPATSCANISRPIPLPASHIHRTSSELQLSEDTVVAEYRELCMYHRLVVGMEERSKKIRDPLLQGIHVAIDPSFSAAPKMKRSSDARVDLAAILRDATDITFDTFGDRDYTANGGDTTLKALKKQDDDERSQWAKALGINSISVSSELDYDDEMFPMDL